jgi:hypothetical protein
MAVGRQMMMNMLKYLRCIVCEDNMCCFMVLPKAYNCLVMDKRIILLLFLSLAINLQAVSDWHALWCLEGQQQNAPILPLVHPRGRAHDDKLNSLHIWEKKQEITTRTTMQCKLEERGNRQDNLQENSGGRKLNYNQSKIT